MPNYLVIETTGGRNLGDGGKVVDANTAHDAAVAVAGDSYAYERTFSVFVVDDASLIKLENERVIRALDAKDTTDTTVLATYDEAAYEELKEAQEARSKGGVQVDVSIKE
jgi:hypothetical protein